MKMIPAGRKSPAGLVFSITLYVSTLRTRWRSTGAKRDTEEELKALIEEMQNAPM